MEQEGLVSPLGGIMYICFEGSDGCGKTTLVDKTTEYLKVRGHEVVVAKNPGATALGQKLRYLIKHDTEIEVDPLTERLLYLCDNSCFVNTLLKPSLNANKVVVADRCNIIGDLMYGEASGVNLKQVYKLHEILGEIPKIDMLFVLWCPWEIAKERMLSRDDTLKCKIEARGDAFFKKVCEQYYELYKTKICCFQNTQARSADDAHKIWKFAHVSIYAKDVIPVDACFSQEVVWERFVKPRLDALSAVK
jgi:dTMP kinase